MQWQTSTLYLPYSAINGSPCNPHVCSWCGPCGVMWHFLCRNVTFLVSSCDISRVVMWHYSCRHVTVCALLLQWAGGEQSVATTKRQDEEMETVTTKVRLSIRSIASYTGHLSEKSIFFYEQPVSILYVWVYRVWYVHEMWSTWHAVRVWGVLCAYNAYHFISTHPPTSQLKQIGWRGVFRKQYCYHGDHHPWQCYHGNIHPLTSLYVCTRLDHYELFN